MANSHIISSNLLVVLVASIFVLSTVVLATTDTSSIDLSMFKLRRVDTKELARKRAGETIENLATGAKHMRESLFVDANYVKCPAYAHLFKLIKIQSTATTSARVVRQSTVESLAIVVTYDRVLYYKLFVHNAQALSASHFIEAIQSLEQEKNPSTTNDAWFDLIGCLSDYMSQGNTKSAKEVRNFLAEPKRSEVLASLKKFKSIPVGDENSMVEGEQAPSGLVANLARKFDGKSRSGRQMKGFSFGFGRKSSDALLAAAAEEEAAAALEMGKQTDNKSLGLNSEDPGYTLRQKGLSLADLIDKFEPAIKVSLDEARELIESFDDESTAEARRRFSQSSNTNDDDEVNLAAEVEAAAGKKEQRKSEDDDALSEPSADTSFEMIVPKERISFDGDSDSDSESELANLEVTIASQEEDIDGGTGTVPSSPNRRVPKLDTTKLAILRFIKIRIENLKTVSRFERAPRLSINLAFDFVHHWHDLSAAAENHLHESAINGAVDLEKDELAKHVQEFLQDETNITLLKRINEALGIYTELTNTMTEMKSKEKYESFEEFRVPFERLSLLLDEMDQAFDVDDLRRFKVIWQYKFKQYSVLDEFCRDGFSMHC